jgi:hypothetical protein
MSSYKCSFEHDSWTLITSNRRLDSMKLLSILSLCAAAAALPATFSLSPRASISKADGLKFNIDGVTKCKFED